MNKLPKERPKTFYIKTYLLVSEAQGKKATGGLWDGAFQGGVTSTFLFTLGVTPSVKR